MAIASGATHKSRLIEAGCVLRSGEVILFVVIFLSCLKQTSFTVPRIPARSHVVTNQPDQPWLQTVESEIHPSLAAVNRSVDKPITSQRLQIAIDNVVRYRTILCDTF